MQVGEATTKVEDWLNASLLDGDFGEELGQLTFFIVSVYDEPEKNQAWASARDKLESFKHPLDGSAVRSLSFGVPIPPDQFRKGAVADWAAIISSAVREKLRVRPKRVAKGFQYERCAAAISASLSAFDPA